MCRPQFLLYWSRSLYAITAAAHNFARCFRPISAEQAAVRAMQQAVRMEPKTIVYMLRSDRDPSRHYTGLTANFERRLQWHNAGQNVDTARDRP